MPAGRPRKPTKLKLVTNTLNVSRVNHDEPDVALGMPKPPDHLTERARKAWKHFSRVLAAMRVLTVADSVALERMCEAYADLVEAQDSYARPVTFDKADKATGEVTTIVVAEGGAPTYLTFGQTGAMLRTRSEKALIAEADARLRAYLGLFGLSPAARSKVNVIRARDEDPASKYFD